MTKLLRFGLIFYVFSLLAQTLEARPTSYSIFKPMVCIPSVDTEFNLWSGIALLNTTNEFLNVELIYRDDNGNDLAKKFVTIAPGNQFADLIQELFGGQLQGYVEVRGIGTGFFLKGNLVNNQVTIMDGAITADYYGRPYLYQVPEIKQDQKAIFYLVNGPNFNQSENLYIYYDETLDFIFRNSKGDKTTILRKKIPAGGRLKVDLVELGKQARIENQIREGGYLEVKTNNEMHGVAGIVIIKEEKTMFILSKSKRGDDLETIFPQFAVGQGTFTEYDFNLDEWSFKLVFEYDDGTNHIKEWPFLNTPKRIYEKITASGDAIITGYIVASSHEVGFVKYGFLDKSLVVIQSHSPRDEIYFGHVANTLGYWTGLALLNRNPGDAKVLIEVFRSDGSKVGEKRITLSRNQKIARLLTEFVSSSVGQAGGYVKITSDLKIYALEIFGRDDLEAMAVVPPN